MSNSTTKTQLEAKAQLLEAELMLSQGKIQSDIREKFGDTLGQKLFMVHALNRRFPNLNIVNRMINVKPDDQAFISFKHVKGSYLPNLVVRSDPKQLNELNTKRKFCNQEQIQPLTESQLEEFFKPGEVVRENRAKMMRRESIDAFIETCPVEIIRDAFKAIDQDNLDLLRKYMQTPTLLNKVISAVVDV